MSVRRGWLAGVSFAALLTAGCGSSLAVLAFQGDAAGVRRLLDEGADANDRDSVCGAIMGDHPDIVKMLLDKGADVNKVFPPTGPTPLLCAAKHGSSVEIVKMLLDRGADPNFRTTGNMFGTGYHEGSSALTVAAEDGHADIAKILATKVADVNATDASKESALYKAVANGHADVVRVLLAAGANPEAGDVWSAAQKSGRADIIAMLTSKQAQTTASPSSPAEPLAAPSPAQAALVPAAPTPPSGPSPFVAAAPQPAAYAFIIGIDHYRDVPAATGARADAEHFAQLARQTLGLKDDHVRVALEDHATKTDILEGLKWLQTSVTAGGRVYFFYSGHGAPTPDSATYLLPYDGNPKDVAGSAIAMNEVMAALGHTKAREVLAVVDACFSGAGGRSVLPPGARPLMRVKEAAPVAQLALFTASQGDEISGTAPGENAGVFTKYVTTGLGTGAADANGDGQVSLQELAEWVSPRVARDSKRDNREQHPKLVVGSNVGDANNFIVEYGLSVR